MNKHGKERLIPLQGKGKGTTMGSRMGSSPSSAGFVITSLLTMSQPLNLWACLVPLSLDLLTPHLEGLNVHCPLYTHTHAHTHTHTRTRTLWTGLSGPTTPKTRTRRVEKCFWVLCEADKSTSCQVMTAGTVTLTHWLSSWLFPFLSVWDWGSSQFSTPTPRQTSLFLTRLVSSEWGEGCPGGVSGGSRKFSPSLP